MRSVEHPSFYAGVAIAFAACASASNDTPRSEGPASAPSASSPASVPAPQAAAPVTPSGRADLPDDFNEGWLTRDGEEAARTLERDGREVYEARQEILEALALEPGQSVADIGAGSGFFTRLFSEAVGPKGTVFANDIGVKMLASIAEEAKKAGRTNIKTVLGTAHTSNLPPASVDLVFISDTYHHFEYPIAMMTSIRKALRPGGRVVLIDFVRIEGTTPRWTLRHVRAGQEVFEREIISAGFRKTEDKELDGLQENYFVVFEKSAK